MIRKVVLPKLVDHDGNLNKSWYVDFQVYNEKTGRMQRFRKFKGFSDFKSLSDRRKFGAKQLHFWHSKLKDKDYNPFEDNIVIIHDLLSYEEDPVKQKASNYNIRYYVNLYFKENCYKLRKKSFQSYQSKSRVFCNWLLREKMEMDHPRFMHLSKAYSFSKYLLEERKLSNKTYNGYITTLGTIWQYFIKFEITDNNPWFKIDHLQVQSTSLRPFSYPQSEIIQRYLQKHDPWLLFFCEFHYHMLTRPNSEQRQLLIDDIDFYTGTLKVRGEISKNHKTQMVAIPQKFMIKLKEWKLDEFPKDNFIFGLYGPADKMAGRDYFSKRFRKVLTKLGIGNDWSMYSWKHTMNQRAAIKGIPLKELQMQNRHHSLDQMDEYLRGLTVLDGYNLFNNLPDM